MYDTETTGFSYFDHVLQIAAVAVRDGQIVKDAAGQPLQFMRYINTTRTIPPAASEVNGITAATLNAHGRDVKVVMQELSAFMVAAACGATIGLAGHNVFSFDNRFLVGTFERAGVPIPPCITASIDILHMARKLKMKSRYNLANEKLTTLYKHVTGSELQNAHDALADTVGTADVLLAPELWNVRMEHARDWSCIVREVLLRMRASRRSHAAGRNRGRLDGSDVEDNVGADSPFASRQRRDVRPEPAASHRLSAASFAPVATGAVVRDKGAAFRHYSGPTRIARAQCRTASRAFRSMLSPLVRWLVEQTNVYYVHKTSAAIIHRFLAWLVRKTKWRASPEATRGHPPSPCRKLPSTRRWKPVTASEIWRFITIIMHRGIVSEIPISRMFSDDPVKNHIRASTRLLSKVRLPLVLHSVVALHPVRISL